MSGCCKVSDSMQVMVHCHYMLVQEEWMMQVRNTMHFSSWIIHWIWLHCFDQLEQHHIICIILYYIILDWLWRFVVSEWELCQYSLQLTFSFFVPTFQKRFKHSSYQHNATVYSSQYHHWYYCVCIPMYLPFISWTRIENVVQLKHKNHRPHRSRTAQPRESLA